MRKSTHLSLLGACAGALLVSLSAFAQPAPEITLTRFADCGTPQAPTEVNLRFSDTYAFPGVKVQFTFSCYLIKRGDEYMIWDLSLIHI